MTSLAEPGLVPKARQARGQSLAFGGVLAESGDLEVKLALSPAELRSAQQLRYQVFYQEMNAIPNARSARRLVDFDAFDGYCDHLIVVDRSDPHAPVVGTYRLLRQEVADRKGGFYTSAEFDIRALRARRPAQRFLELGRSCVRDSHRDKRTLELLWRGIWAYVRRHSVDVMIGCASLRGTDPDALALPLSFLHHTASAPAEWRVEAQPALRVEMNRMGLAEIDTRAAFRALPTLIKGYLRLGAFVGDGAVIDRQFGTIDVCIVLPTAAIKSRYIDHFGTGSLPDPA